MLLQHPWLAALSKPAAIGEEEEEEDEMAGDATSSSSSSSTNGGASSASSDDAAYDEEVAEWVKTALDRKAKGLLGSSAKPALHAVPLDSVSPPAV